MKINALNLLILKMYRSGLVLKYNSPQKKRIGSVDHITCGQTKIAKDYSHEDTLQCYLDDLRYGNYGLMLCNGGLVQISYSLKKQNILSHRYCYIPSPISLTNAIEPEVYLEQVLEFLENKENIFLRSRIRFDFEREVEFEAHPESHLTLISPECRIALRGGLDVKRFFRFIFLNFIDASLITKHQSFFTNESYDLGTLSDQWANELHINWTS